MSNEEFKRSFLSLLASFIKVLILKFMDDFSLHIKGIILNYRITLETKEYDRK